MTTTTDTAPATPEAPTAPAAPTPIPHDGGKPPYADPTGNEAARNVDQERRDAERDGKGKAGADAAKYRGQLREVEAERDGLRSQLEAFQRQAVDQLAEGAGIKPAALWAAGTELGGLLHEDGRVNAEAVTVAIGVAKDALGLNPTASAAAAGITGASGAPAPAEPTWAGITKPRAA